MIILPLSILAFTVVLFICTPQMREWALTERKDPARPDAERGEPP